MKTKLSLVTKGLVIVLYLSLGINVNAQKNKFERINITNFRVLKQQNKVFIQWSTDGTSQTNYFEVEKSTDGKNFKAVAYVLGADPTKADCDCFGCFDKINSKAQESFYRLKHVNTDGNIQFSEVRMLTLK